MQRPGCSRQRDKRRAIVCGNKALAQGTECTAAILGRMVQLVNCSLHDSVSNELTCRGYVCRHARIYLAEAFPRRRAQLPSGVAANDTRCDMILAGAAGKDRIQC